MLHQTLLGVVVLASIATANVLNVNIYTDADSSHNDQAVLAEKKQSTADKVGWKVRDEEHIVPLVPEARTGVLPTEAEEGLIYALGPRFANQFIKSAAEEANNVSHRTASCNLKCMGVLIRAQPCILKALECKCIDPILKCPVKPKELCACLPCLPEEIQKGLEPLCKKATGAGSETLQVAQDDGEGTSYVDSIAYSRQDVGLLAFRGDLRESTVAEIRALAFCPPPFGSCGSCPCCVGPCVLGTCVGACVSGANSGNALGHKEL